MKQLPCLAGAVCALALAFPVRAQTTLVTPVAPAATTGNSNNAFPWNRATGQIAFQQIYAASNFAAIKAPILISRLRYRAVDTAATTSTWTGGTYTGARINMSTCATSAATASATFSANHGADVTQVFPTSGGTNLGSIAVAAGAGTGTGLPGVWYVDVKLAKTFLFDPTKGKDLVVEVLLNGGWSGGTSSQAAAYSGTTVSPQGTRVYNTSSWQATTGTVGLNHSLGTEFTYVPAIGLYASFTASPTTGGQNLQVNFKDTSYTSDAGGIQTWAWDFDGDSKVDSTVQNPTFTYKCGMFSPSLTVTDKAHKPSTRIEKDLIKAGLVTADFAATGSTVGFPPLQVTFSDKSSAGVVVYQWDFDGDNKIDSNAQNPTWTYTSPGTYDVILNVIGPCNQNKATKKAFVVVPGAKDRTVPDILQYQFNDVRGKVSNVVTNSASGTAAGDGTMSVTNWAGDPGRARFNPNEAGFGMNAGGTAKYITTGWNLSATDMTIMFWLRLNSTSTNPFGYCFGRDTGAGSMRCFIAGAAGTGIRYTGSPIGNFDSGGDLQTGKNGVWQHLCLVVDDTNGKAYWYADGKLLNSISFTAKSHTLSGTGFTVGGYTATGSTTVTGGAGLYDMDDFRFYSTALTPAQVAAAVAAENASTSDYGTACASGTATPPTISGNALPLQGNATFAVNVSGAEANAPGAMLVSFWAASTGLPLDVSKQTGVTGCMLELLPALIFPMTTSATGTATLPLPVPIDSVNLPGFHVYCQFGFRGKTTTGVTKGLDINVQ